MLAKAVHTRSDDLAEGILREAKHIQQTEAQQVLTMTPKVIQKQRISLKKKIEIFNFKFFA